MKLLIKQRVFSWSDTYDVYDEYENARYYVKAEFFSFGHQIHVYDRRTNQEVGSIHQRLLTLMPKFEICINGVAMGEIAKKLSLFRPKYEIDYNGWQVEGNCFGWDYDVMANGYVSMHISKELFHWGDTYVIEYMKPEDELMGLLLVIAIDAANCSNN